MDINKDMIIEKMALKIAQLEISLATEQTVREQLVAQMVEMEEAMKNLEESEE